MFFYNCTSSEGLYTIPDSSWCPESGECIMWNVSSEDMKDLCKSRSLYVEKYLGPQRSPLFLPICISYLVIFCVGSLGNTLTCTVIMRHHSMRTPTNFYLLSLAISDLLVLLLGLPLELYELWSNYPFLLGTGGCYFKTCLFETVCFASVLNVTAVSAERYLAVVHPLRVKHAMTHGHVRRVIMALWIVSFLCALPNTSLHGITMLPPKFGRSFPESAVCGLVKPVWIYAILVQLTALLFFLIPMVSIGGLYLLIALQLHRETRLLQNNTKALRSGAQSSLQRTRHRQVTKMLFMLVVVFAICWAPFHVDRVMWSYIEDWREEQHRAFEYVHLLSGVFFYLSSAVNPILYSLMSSRFRELFREVTCWKAEQKFNITQITFRTTV
ncbi:neuromedin-U receptor 1-like [Tachysurus fulvidraco]|uniref:neuromedin-U receptor 1-like n=1 Tax=Tachysurus fulvidraco TaxID=1234273 RepID=UPI000F4FE3FF|nr:neuromedin-U receptor 1-like [Tachysurus fulvidraco]XP_026998254.1 neuromedin-U receptor 1-like [Tachysurus fulvidraco]